jgi:ATP-binding cassette subfamily B (MDR/TAP) protein 9
LERFYRPDKGVILIDDKPIWEYSHKYIHKVIALVGQEPVLYARKISENIAYGLEAEKEEQFLQEKIESVAKMANAHNFIMDTTKKYDTECGERGIQLSGGQKQRIAIARALIRNPRILLLDEATSALDSVSEEQVQQAIYANLKGHTVIVIAHRLSTIQNADKILVINDGQIVEQGNHEELLQLNGLYAKLVRTQIRTNNNTQQRDTFNSTSTN